MDTWTGQILGDVVAKAKASFKPIQHSNDTLCPYGSRDEVNGDYDCEANTILDCDHCKYGGGRKDPLAKRNQIKQIKHKQPKREIVINIVRY